VVVAVISMRVVQVTFDEIIDMVAVRDRFVATIRTVSVACVVPRAAMSRRADVRVSSGNFEHMLFNLPIGIYVVQVSVVQVIDVVTVLYSGVFAIGTVLVIVIGMQIRHDFSSFSGLLLWTRKRTFHRVHDPVGHQTRNVLIG
jgi:hypothetical protein